MGERKIWDLTYFIQWNFYLTSHEKRILLLKKGLENHLVG